jgi:Animal haem peroxidase
MSAMIDIQLRGGHGGQGSQEASFSRSAMIDIQLQGGHGGQGSQEASFSRLLKKDTDYKPLHLSDPDKVIGLIAHAIDQGPDDATDLPDDQENPFVPAGYTYLGQFVDHDLTFDTRSTLQTITPGLSSFPGDERTPRLDMDCLYGLGPTSAPFMYDEDGRLATNPDKPYDLPRSAIRFKPDDPMSHRAIIGDPRNDENSIVCQLQLAFLQFHNAMIAHFKQQGLTGQALFRAAQQEVRFTYQTIVVTDFLARVVQKPVYDAFVGDHKAKGEAAYKLYKKSLRGALPMEFTGAAYRFGHSGVRNAYRLNDHFQRLIFNGADDAAESLVGFGDLPESHIIDWSLFVTDQLAPGTKGSNPSQVGGQDVPPDARRLQYAYKLDTTLVNPLLALPPRIGGPGPLFNSLSARNLKRGYNFSLPSGQDIAKVLGVAKPPPLKFGDQLLAFKDMADIPAADATALEASTPLWLYILAEGQACLAKPDGTFGTKVEGGVTKIDKDSDAGTQLGPVGGRILMEVFFGILDDDPASYFNVTPGTWNSVVKPGAGTITLWDMLRFVGLV